MSVVFYRIDDRLIHGQVMTGWSKVYKANRIFVVDDKVAKDAFMCQVMKMAVPMEKLLNSGVEMKELNLGGMGYVAGRKMILRNIQVSPEELEQLKAIAARGIRVFCQIVPDGKCIEIDKVKL